MPTFWMNKSMRFLHDKLNQHQTELVRANPSYINYVISRLAVMFSSSAKVFNHRYSGHTEMFENIPSRCFLYSTTGNIRIYASVFFTLLHNSSS